jgi:thymidylate kinase
MTAIKRHQFVIVEGPDCSGKSTLVERLKNTLCWDSKYLRHAEGNQFFRYLREYAHGETIVFDRSHFSEEVYSKMWRGGSPFCKNEKKILYDICNMYGLIIFCLPAVENMKERYKKRGFSQQITLGELKKSYELFLEESKHAHIIYHSENYDELETILVKIKEMII